MKGDLPPAAVRILASSCPVRTHSRDFGPIVMDRTEYSRNYQRIYKRKKAAERRSQK